MDISLGTYLKNLKNISLAVEYPMQELFFYILFNIAELQAPDTGYARALIVKGMADKLGTDFNNVLSKLKEFYFWWETHGYPDNVNRRWDNDLTTDSIISLNPGLFTWSSDDEGIIRQQYESWGSKNVEGRSGYYPKGHIDIVAGRFNDEQYKRIWTVIERELEKHIDYYLTHGTPLKRGVR